jgi:hypothetical protein
MAHNRVYTGLETSGMPPRNNAQTVRYWTKYAWEKEHKPPYPILQLVRTCQAQTTSHFDFQALALAWQLSGIILIGKFSDIRKLSGPHPPIHSDTPLLIVRPCPKHDPLPLEWPQGACLAFTVRTPNSL